MWEGNKNSGGHSLVQCLIDQWDRLLRIPDRSRDDLWHRDIMRSITKLSTLQPVTNNNKKIQENYIGKSNLKCPFLHCCNNCLILFLPEAIHGFVFISSLWFAVCTSELEEVESSGLGCRFLNIFPVTSSGVEWYTLKGSREISQAGQGEIEMCDGGRSWGCVNPGPK